MQPGRAKLSRTAQGIGDDSGPSTKTKLVDSLHDVLSKHRAGRRDPAGRHDGRRSDESSAADAASGASFKVTKNRLARRARRHEVRQIGTSLQGAHGDRLFGRSRWLPRRWRSITPKRTRSSPSSAGRRAIRCSTQRNQGARHPAVAERAARPGSSACCRHRRRVSPWSCRRPGTQLARVLGAYANEGRSRLSRMQPD